MVIADLIELLLEECVGNNSGLWKAIDTLGDFELGPAIVSIFLEVVVLDEFFGDVTEADEDVFRASERGFEVVEIEINPVGET